MAETKKTTRQGLTRLQSTYLSPVRDAAAAAPAPRARGLAFALGALVALTVLGLMLSGCSDAGVQLQAEKVARTAAETELSTLKPELAALKKETSDLKAQNAKLMKEVQELRITPHALLDTIKAEVSAEKLDAARASLTTLETRFADTQQAREAKVLVTRLAATVQARKDLAERMEAMGFYALKPETTSSTSSFRIRLESTQIGKRWSFDSNGYDSYYRDAVRGEKYVLLRLTLTNTNKNPDPELPDIGVYAIEGKNMVRIASTGYEFRRWSSYGTYIGLHHDFKNDFAHSDSVLFNAAASVDEDRLKKPFAVVSTGKHCHERDDDVIGQPKIRYRGTSCNASSTLTVDDFSKGEAKVLAFFNKPAMR